MVRDNNFLLPSRNDDVPTSNLDLSSEVLEMLSHVVFYYLGMPVTLAPGLDDFRRRFDPKYGVNEAHATLIAPFPAALMTRELTKFFVDVLARFTAKSLLAEGCFITSRGYAFYTFDVDSAVFLKDLYESLHAHPSLLAQKDHRPFLPHITLGKFKSEKAVPSGVVEELKELCTPMPLCFDRVRLYAILEEPKMRRHVRDFLVS